jgi:hypothetical protein
MPGKKGENKGIAKARKEQKRAEAEARNAKTPPERKRAHRRRLAGVPPEKVGDYAREIAEASPRQIAERYASDPEFKQAVDEALGVRLVES